MKNNKNRGNVFHAGTSSEERLFLLTEIAEKIGGTVVCGDKKYPVYELSPLDMAAEFDLCIIRTDDEALASLNSDADAFVTDPEHVLMLKDGAHVVVTDDLELASSILTDLFN